MNNEQNQAVVVVTDKTGDLRNKSTNLPAILRAEQGTADYVVHLSSGQVKLLAIVAGKNKLHGDRNAVLIKTIFDSALRISEALALRPCDIQHTVDGWLLNILGKGSGGKPGTAAITAGTVADIKSYCFDKQIQPDALIFPISRSQAFRIIQDAYDKAGIRQPCIARDHVGALHVLRHSGAIARMQTSNPKSVQEQLRHKSSLMTLRYMKTIGHDESMRTQQAVDIWRE